MTKDIVTGLILTAFLDQGPVNIYNSSPLHNNDAYNFMIWRLPAFNTDIPFTVGDILPIGLFSTEDNVLHSLTFFFYLPVEFSTDPRIHENGRPFIFWVFSRSKDIIQFDTKIKEIIIQLLRYHKINTDIDLFKKEILKDFSEKLKIA